MRSTVATGISTMVILQQFDHVDAIDMPHLDRGGCCAPRGSRSRRAPASATSMLRVDRQRVEQRLHRLRPRLLEGQRRPSAAGGRWPPCPRARRGCAMPLHLARDRRARRHAGAGRRPLPPPRQCGARVEPWRARPVPFWRYGLLLPPLTSARVLVEALPCRRLTSCAVTTWCSSRRIDRRAEHVADPGLLRGRPGPPYHRHSRMASSVSSSPL